MSEIPAPILPAVQALWDYHDMHHELHPADIGVGLGSHDLGVATYTAELFHQKLFPLIVFTGANAPTTVDRFPRGEALHYREHALSLGVPNSAILVESRATNTGENIEFTRKLLAERAVPVMSAILVSRPYQQRRVYATARKLWPELEIMCASLPLALADYIQAIGDADRVVNMLVGDTQRIMEYPEHGFAIEQEMPSDVESAYRYLVAQGYTKRLI